MISLFSLLVVAAETVPSPAPRDTLWVCEERFFKEADVPFCDVAKYIDADDEEDAVLRYEADGKVVMICKPYPKRDGSFTPFVPRLARPLYCRSSHSLAP